MRSAVAAALSMTNVAVVHDGDAIQVVGINEEMTNDGGEEESGTDDLGDDLSDDVDDDDSSVYEYFGKAWDESSVVSACTDEEASGAQTGGEEVIDEIGDDGGDDDVDEEKPQEEEEEEEEWDVNNGEIGYFDEGGHYINGCYNSEEDGISSYEDDYSDEDDADDDELL